ncbi:Arc family DNA-binding protein [Ancylobacter crimeensis]|uniref:Arc family DNA-binding protein n=1 Tax=Ancylobacter crimeensis TaxID=2579147 RepID=UPI00248BA8CB|nr:Arc family DNA-binding protein [Ancylobacter crimeensis]
MYVELQAREIAHSMAKTPAPSDLADKVMLRLPDGMRDRLAEAARENGRSMNAEIVSRLEKSLDQFKTLEQLVEEVEQSRELWGRVEDLEYQVRELTQEVRRMPDRGD